MPARSSARISARLGAAGSGGCSTRPADRDEKEQRQAARIRSHIGWSFRAVYWNREPRAAQDGFLFAAVFFAVFFFAAVFFAAVFFAAGFFFAALFAGFFAALFA
ncbi:MAG TPA: hypothetical protein VGB85_18910, partial [Nannocystis sp.]